MRLKCGEECAEQIHGITAAGPLTLMNDPIGGSLESPAVLNPRRPI